MSLQPAWGFPPAVSGASTSLRNPTEALAACDGERKTTENDHSRDAGETGMGQPGGWQLAAVLMLTSSLPNTNRLTMGNLWEMMKNQSQTFHDLNGEI